MVMLSEGLVTFAKFLVCLLRTLSVMLMSSKMSKGVSLFSPTRVVNSDLRANL